MFRLLDGKSINIVTSAKVCRNLISVYVYVICQMTSKRTYFFHIVKDIITNVRYWYGSASTAICLYMCYAWYSIPNTEYVITDLTIAKVPVSFP